MLVGLVAVPEGLAAGALPPLPTVVEPVLAAAPARNREGLAAALGAAATAGLLVAAADPCSTAVFAASSCATFGFTCGAVSSDSWAPSLQWQAGRTYFSKHYLNDL